MQLQNFYSVYRGDGQVVQTLSEKVLLYGAVSKQKLSEVVRNSLSSMGVYRSLYIYNINFRFFNDTMLFFVR